MATPLAGLAKAAFNTETTYGTAAVIDADDGLLLYFEPPFNDNTAKTPQKSAEIQGTSARDHTGFDEGGKYEPGFTLTYPMRYYGGHFVMCGYALGDGVTSGAGPYVHASVLADAPESFTTIVQVPVIIGGSSAQRDNNFKGCQIMRSIWSHKEGDYLKHTIEVAAAGVDYDVTPATLPSGAGEVPLENLISWSHKDATIGIRVKRDAGSNVSLNCVSWEIVLDEGLVRSYYLQTGKLAGKPIPGDDERTVTVKLEIDQDDAWQEIMQAFGYLSSDLTTDISVEIKYADPAAATHTLFFEVGNCRPFNVPRGIQKKGGIRQTVELRAHFQTSGYPMNDPLRITMQNSTQGTVTVPTYGAYF